MAMKLSPDSLLLSPRNAARDEEILIISSPEQELKKTPKVCDCMTDDYWAQSKHSVILVLGH